MSDLAYNHIGWNVGTNKPIRISTNVYGSEDGDSVVLHSHNGAVTHSSEMFGRGHPAYNLRGPGTPIPNLNVIENAIKQRNLFTNLQSATGYVRYEPVFKSR